jgi:chaperonin GroEL (HSP60 family)
MCQEPDEGKLSRTVSKGRCLGRKLSIDPTKDKKLRLEDAINATRAAVEEGIVPGGGATFTHLSENLVNWAKTNLKEDELIGAMIISRAILAPLRRIAENAGINGAVINNKNLKLAIMQLKILLEICMKKVLLIQLK